MMVRRARLAAKDDISQDEIEELGRLNDLLDPLSDALYGDGDGDESSALPQDLQTRISALGFKAWIEADHPYFVVHFLDPHGIEAAELPPYLTHDEAVQGIAQAVAVVEEGD